MKEKDQKQRRKGEAEIKDEAEQNRHVAPPDTWLATIRKTPQLLNGMVMLLVKPEETIEEGHDFDHFSRRTFIYCYVITTLIGFITIVLYALFGGYRYHNTLYLFLIPLTSLVSGLLIVNLFQLGIFVMWGSAGFTNRKISYLKHLFGMYVLMPVICLFYPLKHIWPQSIPRHHLFYLSLVFAVYLFVLILRKGSKYFRRDELAIGLILSGVPYFIFLYNFERIARIVFDWVSLWFLR